MDRSTILATELKAVLFDLDDTLLVEQASAEAAFLATCTLAQNAYGADPTDLHQAVRDTARTLWHASPARAYCLRVGVSSWEGLWARFEGTDPNLEVLRAWAPAYRLGAWSEALARFGIHDDLLAHGLAEEFGRQRRMRHVLFPDAMPTLEALQGRFRLGLITNGLSCLQREKIHGSGLAGRFDAIVVSGDLGIGKPDPAIFREAMRQLCVRASQAVMVGNGLKTDIAGAQAAGLRALWLDRHDPHGKDETIRPDAVIAGLADVLGHVQPLG